VLKAKPGDLVGCAIVPLHRNRRR